jgi:hypothetical protein
VEEDDGKSEDERNPALEDQSIGEDGVSQDDSDSIPALAYPLASCKAEGSGLIVKMGHAVPQLMGCGSAAQGAMQMVATRFGLNESNGPIVQSLLAEERSDTGSQEIRG